MIIDNFKTEDLLEYRMSSFKVGFISILTSIKHALKIGTLSTGIIAKINNSTTYRSYLISEGIKNLIDKINDQKSAKAIYPHIYNTLNTYRKLHSSLEKADFFNDSRIMELSESTLANFYRAEARMRHLAYSEKNDDSGDDELNKFASALSLGSLQA